MDNQERGSDRTTAQMLGAPKDAVFVWCNEKLYYPNKLACSLGRSDLKIVGPSWLESHNNRGLRASGIVVDHWTKLNERQEALLWVVRAHVKN